MREKEIKTQEKVIENLKRRRQENSRIISEVIEFLTGMGKMRRIRPCDMNDEREKECPANNVLKRFDE